MSGIQFGGLATGLDTASIVSQLVAIRRQPIVRLEARKALLEKQTAALNELKTKLLALRDAAAALDSAREFAANRATSTHESLLAVTAESTAAPGSYQVEVQSLAARQKDVTQGYATLQDAVGTGSFSLTVGGEVHAVAVTDGTLAGLRDAINGAGLGVQATVLNDGTTGTPYRLVLTSTETGLASAYTADFSGLSGGAAPVLTQVTAAADAALLIDSIPVVSPDNLVGGAITGLSFELLAAEPGTTITVQVESDSVAIADRVQAFVDAYNAVAGYLEEQAAADATLRGHPALRSVGSRLSSLVLPAGAATGRYRMLAEVGVRLGEDGQLTLDRDRFTAALAESYAGVEDLFIPGADAIGKADIVRAAIEDLTGASGLFKISSDGIADKIESIEQSIARYERGVESYRSYLQRKFTAMESLVSGLQAQSSYLNAQMTSMLLS